MENNINQIAYELFRQWTKSASIDYTELDFTIIDEGVLIKDLEESLESGIESLFEKERAEKRLKPGYDYGFIIGYLHGKINLR